jgi:hypothetical protein
MIAIEVKKTKTKQRIAQHHTDKGHEDIFNKGNFSHRNIS